jgi:hypothetical protein
MIHFPFFVDIGGLFFLIETLNIVLLGSVTTSSSSSWAPMAAKLWKQGFRERDEGLGFWCMKRKLSWKSSRSASLPSFVEEYEKKTALEIFEIP